MPDLAKIYRPAWIRLEATQIPDANNENASLLNDYLVAGYVSSRNFFQSATIAVAMYGFISALLYRMHSML